RPGEGAVVLRGYRRGKPYEQVIDVTLPEHEAGNEAIASMWARAKVDDLMWQDLAGLQSGNFPAALREEIVQTGLAHRIMTQFTAFVAVEDRVVNEGGTQRTVAVPVEMPQGVRYDGIFGGRPDSDPAVGQLGRAAAAPAAKYAAVAGETLGLRSSLRGLGDEVDERSLDKAKRQRAPAPSRLVPELQALLEGAPSPGRPVRVVDGRVEVKVLVHGTHRRSLRRLEAAGLRLYQVAARWVVGSIEVAKLTALAAVVGV